MLALSVAVVDYHIPAEEGVTVCGRNFVRPVPFQIITEIIGGEALVRRHIGRLNAFGKVCVVGDGGGFRSKDGIHRRFKRRAG